MKNSLLLIDALAIITVLVGSMSSMSANAMGVCPADAEAFGVCLEKELENEIAAPKQQAPKLSMVAVSTAVVKSAAAATPTVAAPAAPATSVVITTVAKPATVTLVVATTAATAKPAATPAPVTTNDITLNHLLNKYNAYQTDLNMLDKEINNLAGTSTNFIILQQLLDRTSDFAPPHISDILANAASKAFNLSGVAFDRQWDVTVARDQVKQLQNQLINPINSLAPNTIAPPPIAPPKLPPPIIP